MTMKANAAFWTTLIGLVIALPMHAENVYPLETSQVAQALSAAGIAVSPNQVTLAAQVVARQIEARLQVLEIQQAPGGPASPAQDSSAWWVKLGCQDSSVCVPFYAVIHWPGQSPALPAQPHARSTPRPTASGPIAIHAGKHAMMAIERERSRIEIAVVTMENGAIGQTIRVSTPDRKHIFRAEVVSAEFLKGGL